MGETLMVQPDLDFIRKVKSAGGDTLKKCYQCATCSVVCGLSPEEKPFPRKEMLWAGWGLKDKLMSDPDVWLCHQCNDCTTQCPRGARPGDVLAAIRAMVFENFAFPSFMGKALNNSKALPWLLLVPAILLFVLLMSIHGWSFGFFADEQIEYSEFFPHMYLEILFMGGNALIFAFAAVGLIRFWKTLKHSAGKQSPKFIPSLISTIFTILSHKRFNVCVQNKPRYLGHLLIFYGFIGAMATAGLAVALTTLVPENFLLHIQSPINLPNPVKILGVASGLGMIIGGWILISRRRNKDDDTGADGYADWLFLWMLFLTAITGMLTYGFRGFGIPAIAYTTYFIHLVIVFFVLWYAPYSKFAHMFYRTLAMVWAHGVRRGDPRKN